MLKNLRFLALLIAVFIVFEQRHACGDRGECSVNKTSNYCRVSERNGSSKVTCRIRRICQLHILMGIKIVNASEMDLSSNQLTFIGAGAFVPYGSIIDLSLAYNEIRVLSYEAFSRLDNLQTLNLKMNPLRTFIGTLAGVFPSLTTLDVTGVEDWKPDAQFLQLRMLQRVHGLKWSAQCSSCSFLKKGIMSEKWLFRTKIVYFRCHKYTYTLRNSSIVAQLLRNTSFDFRCQDSWRCLRRSRDYATKIQLHCWTKVLKAIRIQGCLGFVAIITNLVVFLNIVTSKPLRKNVSVLFLCNMAVSDLVLGVYSLSISAYFSSSTPSEVFNDGPQNCWKIGLLWILGETVAVLTSFLLTLERYLVLIFLLRRNIRISGRLAVILIAITWTVAVFFTGYSLYFNFFFYTFLCVPISLNSKQLNVFAFTIVIATISLSLHLTSSIMYIHIYVNSKKTSHSAGVKKESKTAKKIAILVFSNIFFFVFPLVTSGTLHVFIASIENYFGEEFLYIITTFLPSLSLIVNSCLNPFLYAFRNERFLQVLRQRLTHTRELSRSCLPKNSVDPEHHRNDMGTFNAKQNNRDSNPDRVTGSLHIVPEEGH